MTRAGANNTRWRPSSPVTRTCTATAVVAGNLRWLSTTPAGTVAAVVAGYPRWLSTTPAGTATPVAAGNPPAGHVPTPANKVALIQLGTIRELTRIGGAVGAHAQSEAVQKASEFRCVREAQRRGGPKCV